MKKLEFEKLREVPRGGTLALTTLVLFIPFFFLTLFFVFNERALMASSGYGVLDLELAWTPSMVHRIFAAWGTAEVRYQVFTHQVDNLYLVVYGILAALVILLIARRLKGGLRKIGFFFALTPILAAVFDAMENTFLLSMLNRRVGFARSSPPLASICATFKIAFLEAALSFVFVAALLLLLRKYGVPDIYYYLALVAAGAIVIWLLAMWRPYLCFVIAPTYFAIVLLIVLTVRSDSRQEALEFR